MEEPAQKTKPADAPYFGELTDDDKTMGLLAHLLGIFTGFVGPLVIWLVKKDDSAFVDDQAKESLNFQLTLIVVYAVIVASAVVTCGITAVLAIPLVVANVVFPILGAVKAKDGQAYRYPWRLELVK